MKKMELLTKKQLIEMLSQKTKEFNKLKKEFNKELKEHNDFVDQVEELLIQERHDVCDELIDYLQLDKNKTNIKLSELIKIIKLVIK